MLKSAVRTLIQEQMDDASASRWSAANLDLLTETVYDEGWSEMLDQHMWLNSFRQIITATGNLTSPGFLDTSVAGNILTNRLYRVQKVLRDSQEYSPADASDHLIDQANSDHLTGGERRYFFIGDQLWFTPLNVVSDDIDLRYSFYPASYDGLADNVAISWPDGHEKALIYRVAINAMAKGSAEDVKELEILEFRAWQALRRYLRRRTPGPLTMDGNFTTMDWGG